MKMILSGPLAVALALASAPSFAAEGLDCMDAAFSEQHQQLFDRFSESFKVDLMDDMPLPPELMVPIAERAEMCRTTLGWSEEAHEQAVIHFTAGLLDKLVTANAPFSASDWARLRAAYATIDKAMVRQLIEPIMNNGEPDSQAEEASDLYFGEFFVRTGISESDRNAETVGVWIGAQGMMEIAAERFAAY